MADIRRLWPQVLDAVKDRRRYTWILLSQNSQVLDLNGNELVLALSNVGARDSFVKGGSEDILTDALVQVMGANLRISLVVDPSTASGPPGRSAGTNPSRPNGPTPTGDTSRPRPAGRSAAGSANPPPAPVPSTTSRPSSTTPTGMSTGMSTATASSPPAGPSAEPWPDEPPPDDTEESEPRPDPTVPTGQARGPEPTPTRPAVVAAIREEIRPTRSGPGGTGAGAGRGHDDGGADRDDVDVDESLESHSELLARRLGAQVIDDEPAP